MIRILGLVTAVLCLGLGLAPPASAQNLPSSAIALTPGAALTVMGVTFTVDSVSCNDGGTNNCAKLWMVPSGVGTSIIIEAASGIGNPLIDILDEKCTSTACFPVQNYDLSVDLTASTAAGSLELTKASTSITGSAPGGWGTAVYGTESFPGTSGCPAGLNVSLVTPSASCQFSATSSVTANKDYGLMTYLGQGEYQLATITEAFQVPEPASIALFISGVIALGAVQYRRRKL